VYSYFPEKTSLESRYRLISYVATQSITWIMAWDYIIEPTYENVDIKSLSRKLKIKCLSKFNMGFISKRNIDQWQANYRQKKEEINLSLTQESLFLVEKQQLLEELAATSMKEFEQIIKAKSTTSKTDSEEENSQFNPYDMFE